MAIQRWSQWPIVERDATERVMEVLEKNPAGVVLIGSEGAGKSTLAAQAAARLGRGEPLPFVGGLAQVPGVVVPYATRGHINLLCTSSLP